jgi:hypothetical protein
MEPFVWEDTKGDKAPKTSSVVEVNEIKHMNIQDSPLPRGIRCVSIKDGSERDYN